MRKFLPLLLLLFCCAIPVHAQQTATITLTFIVNPAGTPGTHNVTLTWTAAKVSTGNNIYRATMAGGPYQKINGTVTITSQPFVDSTVQAGTTYHYVMTTIAPGGKAESEYSADTPATVPSP